MADTARWIEAYKKGPRGASVPIPLWEKKDILFILANEVNNLITGTLYAATHAPLARGVRNQLERLAAILKDIGPGLSTSGFLPGVRGPAPKSLAKNKPYSLNVLNMAIQTMSRALFQFTHDTNKRNSSLSFERRREWMHAIAALNEASVALNEAGYGPGFPVVTRNGISRLHRQAMHTPRLSVSLDNMPLPPPKLPAAGAHVDYDDLPPPPPGILADGEQDLDGPLPPLPPSTPPLSKKNGAAKGGQRSRRGKRQVRVVQTKRKRNVRRGIGGRKRRTRSRPFKRRGTRKVKSQTNCR